MHPILQEAEGQLDRFLQQQDERVPALLRVSMTDRPTSRPRREETQFQVDFADGQYIRFPVERLLFQTAPAILRSPERATQEFQALWDRMRLERRMRLDRRQPPPLMNPGVEPRLDLRPGAVMYVGLDSGVVSLDLAAAEEVRPIPPPVWDVGDLFVRTFREMYENTLFGTRPGRAQEAEYRQHEGCQCSACNPDPEELERRRQIREHEETRRLEWERRRREDECRRAEADVRSIVLLREWLSPAQLSDFNESWGFDVTGSASGKRYRIFKRASFNVITFDDKGEPAHYLCFAPCGIQAVGDIMLAQKIALETDERAALAVANMDPAPPLANPFAR